MNKFLADLHITKMMIDEIAENYLLQHSYSKAPVELEPKFGQIIHKTKPTYYNTATPRLQWS